MNNSVEDDGTVESPGGSRRGGGRAGEDLELRRYLLGEGLSDEEREDLEERLSEDGALFERMRRLEDELVDEYVLGSLAEGERRSFETHFLSTRGRLDSVKLALAFAALAAERVDEKTPDPARRGLLAKLRAHLKIPDEFFVLVLAPQLVRGAAGEGTSGEAPAGPRPLQINLLLEEDLYASYRAELRSPRGRTTLVGEKLRAVETEAGPAVVLTLPQGLAAPGHYSIVLTGTSSGGADEKAGVYFFSAK